MNRREFFCRFVPFLGQASGTAQAPEQAERPLGVRLTEAERFLRAMAMGIDPATLTPGQLEALVPDPEPQPTPPKQERLDSEA